MKKLIFLIFFIGISILGFWWNGANKPVSDEQRKISFVIPRGSNASEVGEKLKNEGLVKDQLVFKILVKLTAKSQKIQAGEYLLSKNLSLSQIVEKLTSGPDMVWVTIPEGLRREEIAQKLTQILGKNESFRNEFLAATKAKEGFLFPDTYLFSLDVTADAVKDAMLSNFEKRIAQIPERDIFKDSYSTYELVTMASLIERETKNREEKPVVAGILYKRIEAGWPLQVDATVQFAKASSGSDKWWPSLTKEDIGMKSPYNTYRVKGLPPSPIANPGIESIKGAVYPKESQYWFYLHDSKSRIHYAETLKDHEQNIAKYIYSSYSSW